MALIHILRGERAHADRHMDLLQCVDATIGHSARRAWSYVNRVLVLAGNSTRHGRGSNSHLPDGGWPVRPEAMCEWVPAASAWDRAGDIELEVRAIADDGGLVGSHLFADRLAGLATCHAGDIEHGVATLERARDGFLEHGARWEAARTDLAIAEALTPQGLHDAQSTSLVGACSLFEELGSVAELRRARSLIEEGEDPI